ncbi:MAG: V-type ATP synthase subunit I [Treponema sp.]|jgi:V/A-type H+-transporting ATPase subunit I|nr:V-type ATP synthase subunit I [Treponema sp.]
MKHVRITILKSDVNAVIEYLGHNRAMHFGESSGGAESADHARVRGLLERLCDRAEYLEMDLPSEPDAGISLPGEAEEALAESLCAAVDSLRERETSAWEGKQRLEESFDEVKAFSSLNIPFSDLDQLSYLTLRVGRLDPKIRGEVKERLGDRAVIIPLGEEGGDRVLAVSSRKGRFALDSELKKNLFEPIAVPEGFRGVPGELLKGIKEQLEKAGEDLAGIAVEKKQMREENHAAIRRLFSSLLMALAAEQLKSRLACTSSIYQLSGWVPSDMIRRIVADLDKITGGRAAIQAYAPREIAEVREGSEKVPVALKHGVFVKGFEGLVFSYGAPPYGAIDPTPLVAVFFTLLFGIMFGDVGQGFVLFLLGLLTSKRGLPSLAKFKNYSLPLIAAGVSSMVMGFLVGSVFTNEHLLVAPTRAITGAITGIPQDRILAIVPMEGTGGSVQKLFYFFGFTIVIGIIINSLGLIINIINSFAARKYEAALFAKTGLAGLLLFWYAISIAVRILLGGRFEWFDLVGILFPFVFILFRSVIWRCITRERPILEHGLMLFIMEGLVEVIETVSTYVSNTVSFLRVGAFTLSHAVLSYIVFRFTEDLAHMGGPVGSLSALLVFLFGNLVIIVLEGMIVAIQVVRLQYYEFFSKFFFETGVAFSPFRFRKSETE